jgi:hypothetical protein
MNLLFWAAPKAVYAFFTTEACPKAFAPFPLLIPGVPNFSECMEEKECATAHAKHALNKKTRANIIRMNIALTNVVAFHPRSTRPSNKGASASSTLYLLRCSYSYGSSTTIAR